MKILKTYYDTSGEYQGIDILSFGKDRYFRWFTDCGAWFIYIGYKNHGVRFSSAGFMRW